MKESTLDLEMNLSKAVGTGPSNVEKRLDDGANINTPLLSEYSQYDPPMVNAGIIF